MSKRTSDASKAIRKAWQQEQERVLEGKGTRDWTPEQQQDIIEKQQCRICTNCDYPWLQRRDQL
ncbi:MAG: hypothetical protein IJJ76_10320 [Ruminococcus sp.]|uniref:hypothetical protein n=1 Tax=Ruminococcus sp. TaxID=41978 RepID=UPI0025F0B995|nr:hypothetical protein [Ruminococcus sp.]MBR0530137.1 hypothetical protein [Ruminococcus sp.]